MVKGFKIFIGEKGYHLYDQKNDNISIPYTKDELNSIKSGELSIEWSPI